MARGAFSLAFKIKAARPVTDRGVAVAQAAWGLDLAERIAPLDAGADRNACCYLSREWADADHLAEISALKQEVALLRAERDILKKAAAFFVWEVT
jgi:transposase